MEHWYTVVIPTRDSAGWISPLLRHYLARGVVPHLLVDARTQDNTRELAAALGVATAEVHGFAFTEGVVRQAKELASTPWVLFIHDDEIPSDALFTRLRGPQPSEEVQSVAIPRRWAWHEPGQALTFGRSGRWADRALHPGADHGWRLFRPDRVQYVAAMHSDGFYIDKWSRFSIDQYFVHFEWIVRTHAQRAAKLRRYDEYRFGYGKFFEPMYLPESQPEGLIEYLPFETHEFDDLAHLYYGLRRDGVPSSRRSLKVQATRVMSFIKDRLRPTDFMQEPEDRKGLNVRLENERPDTAI